MIRQRDSGSLIAWLTDTPFSALKLSARHQPRANESQEGKNGADNEYRARNRREGDYQLKKLKRDRTCCACGSDSDEDANEFTRTGIGPVDLVDAGQVEHEHGRGHRNESKDDCDV